MQHVASLQLATTLSAYPESIEDAKQIITLYNERMDHLLNLYKIDISSALFDSDPELFCILSPFNLEIYYEADFRDVMHKHYNLRTKVFPELSFTHPSIIHESTKTKRKIGIASGFFYDNNSVISDFRGILDRLPRAKFDITYIYIKECAVEFHPCSYLENRTENAL